MPPAKPGYHHRAARRDHPDGTSEGAAGHWPARRTAIAPPDSPAPREPPSGGRMTAGAARSRTVPRSVPPACAGSFADTRRHRKPRARRRRRQPPEYTFLRTPRPIRGKARKTIVKNTGPGVGAYLNGLYNSHPCSHTKTCPRPRRRARARARRARGQPARPGVRGRRARWAARAVPTPGRARGGRRGGKGRPRRRAAAERRPAKKAGADGSQVMAIRIIGGRNSAKIGGPESGNSLTAWGCRDSVVVYPEIPGNCREMQSGEIAKRA